MTDQAFYQRHIFFCTNQREGGRACCAELGSADAQAHCKARIKALGLAGPGQVRVNAAGCLDRCEMGPVAVVYPEGAWYCFVDQADLDEIIDQHLVQGRVVERLRI